MERDIDCDGGDIFWWQEGTRVGGEGPAIGPKERLCCVCSVKPIAGQKVINHSKHCGEWGTGQAVHMIDLTLDSDFGLRHNGAGICARPFLWPDLGVPLSE